MIHSVPVRRVIFIGTFCAAVCVGALLFVPSCGSDTQVPARPDASTTCNGFCIDAQTFDVPTCSDASLACVVATHLYTSCAGPTEPNCHGGDNNPANFKLLADPEQTLAMQLVDADSTERTDWKRVNPGHPEISWIIAKLRNDKDAGVEAAMPKGTEGDPAFADLVEKWILAGAPTSLAVPDAASETDADARDADDATTDSDSSDAGPESDGAPDD